MNNSHSALRLFALWMAALSLFCQALPAIAHPVGGKPLPPTKATADLKQARVLMDVAKQKLAAQGRYACCIKAPAGAKAPGCDLCAKENDSCRCGSSLAQGRGVCGECLQGWQSGRGAMALIDKSHVTLQASPTQKSVLTAEDPPELAQAREAMNKAKRTLFQEGRFQCCVSHGGCDSCAYETNCPCGKAAQEGRKGEGICGQCFDGWNAGIGRLSGLTAQEMKLEAGGQGMEMHGMASAMSSLAGVSEMQQASGTSWQPADSPMFALHNRVGRWNTMTHYNVFLDYDRQGGSRGDYQYNSINWGMFMAERSVHQDQLMLRSMLSLDPLTVTPGGYPLLFQTGEAYHGNPLVDRQHPHNFFMELAAKYTHPLDKESAVFAYYAPVGEPALGPTVFMHRASALDNPAAPIGHHWQDSTHISSGVFTLGGRHKNVQADFSAFTGREPDEFRYEIGPERFDSFSGRISYNPARNWSLQTSYGDLHSPEQLHPGEEVRRTTVSASYTIPRRDSGFLASTLVWGRNNTSGDNTDSLLLESDLNLANRNTVFGRLEYVQKTGEELNIVPFGTKHDIGQFTLGYVYDFTPKRAYQTGIGASVTFSVFPSNLNLYYGSAPISYWIFLRIRPAPH